MKLHRSALIAFFAVAAYFFPAAPIPAVAQSSGSSSSSSSSSQISSSGQMYAQEKAPSLIDPAGPTVSLISSEPVFVMAAGLNACGYDEGLDQSAPVRKHVRDEMNRPLPRAKMPAPSATLSAFTLPSTA